ncbi:MAG: YbhB/YbcL family Raf kinase inhibitor-like protein [Candidatus Nanoarchaeia archaeon]|nr:YbhB/YbcL family Raf kinase inhibitor-like protein [Candidatus Nanoarchaeia archaeon]
MKIKSIFNNTEKIPSKYTADGDDINPPLEIFDIPQNAKTLVLIVDDPDAPAGVWVHWILFNIPIINKIKENSVPNNSKPGMNSAGKTKYHGPSPPSGTHRYFFKLYALDTMLNLPQASKRSEIEQAMQGHILAKAEIIGLYSRT